MKRILLSFVFLALTGCGLLAEETPMQKYGFRLFPQEKPVAASAYHLTFIRAEPDKNHGSMGLFKFRHTLDKPLQMSGFGFQPDGSFRVRFERFSKLQGSRWEQVGVAYCGTGKRDFTIEPNRDYVLRVPLRPFIASGSRGVVLLKGQDFVVMSDEFDGEVVRKNTDQGKPSK